MISNLILDIGNVICDWNPQGLAGSSFDDPADQEEALRVTVRTQDWLALDRGDMTLADAVTRAQARTHLDPKAIASIYDNLCASLQPLQGSVDAMARARDKGVPMYILSNMQEHAWAHLKNTYECFSWCSGYVISCEAHLIKPDPAIYQYLCDKFSVTPSSCLFIDDMQENIDAAIAFGMEGEQLKDKQQGGVLVDEVVGRILSGS